MAIEKIRTIIIDMVEEKPDSELTPATSLRNDLGMDSLKLAQLTVEIEDHFGIDIFEEGSVETLGDILKKLGND